MWRTRFISSAAVAMLLAGMTAAAHAAPPDYARDVAPIFARYCVGCHDHEGRDSGLSLESFVELQKGGERGAVIVPGRSDASLLMRVLSGEVEPRMPPEDYPRPTEEEVAVLRAWIDAGAAGPDGAEPVYPELATPEIAAQPHVRPQLTSLALSPDGTRLALGGYRGIDWIDAASREAVLRVEPLPGKVNHLAYSRDGSLLVAASGIGGLYGVATICRADDGQIVAQIKGHRDALYDAELSPDGRLLATCSYDGKISLWDAGSGELVRTIAGHHGAVFDLAFTPDGAILASASADTTVKIWRVATGERLDTLSQPEGDQYAVAISPDGRRIVAGGDDRQLRMWRLLSRDRPTINPLACSRAGHDSPIVKVAFSPDGSKLLSAGEGGDVILWNAADLTPLERLEQQPAPVTGLAFAPEGDACYVARLDGTWQRYPIEAGEEYVSLSRLTPEPVGLECLTYKEGDPPHELTEHEPNNSPADANEITIPAIIRGVIGPAADAGQPDTDLYRFRAQAGQQLVLEIRAARDGSPLDSRLEVLDAAGEPIPRVVLQAVRQSYFTFRGLNSSEINEFRLHGWQDIEVNEYLYANGEVVKLWLYPRGPDSGFLVYPGVGGSRWTYFGTTALAHALNEPCYIVEPHPPGTELIPNGLPQFTLYYENDDDGWRKLGADSRLTFTAPADGEYMVRVSDVRGYGGEEYRYELTVRPPRPDFEIKLHAPDLTTGAGSGKEFSVEADRIDEFDGEIHLEIAGLPPGFHVSSPMVIEAGQTTAYGTITADADAPEPTAENAALAKITASASIGGERVVKEPIELGELKLAQRPKLLVHVEPTELVIVPGETITATVRVERHGFDGDIAFGTEYAGRNLPHGVYIDNIGLNGLTLLEGESERTFFITAAKWVAETSRPFHLRAQVEGNQTSRPIMLHVRHR